MLDSVLRHVGPKQFRVLVNEQWLKLPRELRGRIGVDRANRRGIYFERPAMIGLQASIAPGACVFDVGCSYGLITCLMARIGGPAATVHAFEANGQVFEWAQEILRMNGHAEQTVLTRACVGETSEGNAEFHSVPGWQSVASTRNAEIRHFHADATTEQVPLLSLDDYCARSGVIPSCVKIDVEGSECLVVRGAARLLETHHPHLIIETHGLEIDGIGGSVQELTRDLEGLGYRLMNLSTMEPTSGETYAQRYANAIGYLRASR